MAPSPAPLRKVFLAGGCAGAVSALVASPTELIKVRSLSTFSFRWFRDDHLFEHLSNTFLSENEFAGSNATGNCGGRAISPREGVSGAGGSERVADAGHAAHRVEGLCVHGHLFCYYFRIQPCYCHEVDRNILFLFIIFIFIFHDVLILA